MGLTIYYSWRTPADADAARSLVGRLHAAVRPLAFDDVSDVYEWDPPDGRYAFERQDDDPAARFWKPGDLYVRHRLPSGEGDLVPVPAQHLVYFVANVAGSESALFGLASHPSAIVYRASVTTTGDDGIPTTHVGAGEPVEVDTRCRGLYAWQGFCKTQYAGNPTLGGADNFLRAHRSVFAACDAARRMGLRVRVRDDGNFWRDRDEAKLRAELGRWDALIAGFAGAVSDALPPGAVVAPIKDRPDFEHLEARGAAALRRPPAGP